MVREKLMMEERSERCNTSGFEGGGNGAMNPGVWAASGNWKRQGTDPPIRLPERNAALQAPCM